MRNKHKRYKVDARLDSETYRKLVTVSIKLNRAHSAIVRDGIHATYKEHIITKAPKK